VPKVLDEDHSRPIREIGDLLRERFKIGLPEQEIARVMNELALRKIAAENGHGWTRTDESEIHRNKVVSS
jgi:hypothetical protein